MAVAVGHLVKYSNWSTEDSDIWLSISGDNYQIQHSAEYSSKKLEGLEKAATESRVEEQF